MEENKFKSAVETFKVKLFLCSHVEVLTDGHSIIVRSDSENIASGTWVSKVALVAETFNLTYYISKNIVNGKYEAYIYEV